MLAVSMLVATLSGPKIHFPRECASCGVYAGPNLALVLDPYLRRVDLWPEFDRATCGFEVARGVFVTLGRPACASEAAYRSLRGVG